MEVIFLFLVVIPITSILLYRLNKQAAIISIIVYAIEIMIGFFLYYFINDNYILLVLLLNTVITIHTIILGIYGYKTLRKSR
jgi:hypothetical protein